MRNGKYWNFEVAIEHQYLHVNYVHPLKQLDLYYIVEEAKRDCDVEAIVVFGSAVRFDCSGNSDIDVLVVCNNSEYKSPVNYELVKSDVDIIYSWRCGKKLLSEIYETGVLVYRR